MSTINAYCGECGTFTPVPDTENCTCPKCGHKIGLPDKIAVCPTDITVLHTAFKNRLNELGMLSRCFFDEDVVSEIILLPAYKVMASGSVGIVDSTGRQSRNKLEVNYCRGFAAKTSNRPNETCSTFSDISLMVNPRLTDLSSARKMDFQEWQPQNVHVDNIEFIELPNMKTFLMDERVLRHIRAEALKYLNTPTISKIETRIDSLEVALWFRSLYIAKIVIDGVEYSCASYPEDGHVFFDNYLNPEKAE